MLPKRGQEELVGFVLVVAVVAIGGLILLSLVVRIDGGTQETKSADIAQFLESTWQTTTACHLSSSLIPVTLAELATSCAADRNTRCREGQGACALLNTTMAEVIRSSWEIEASAPTQGYEFSIAQVSNRTRGAAGEPMLALHEGTCAGNYRAGEHLQPGRRRGTTLVTTLKLCLS